MFPEQEASETKRDFTLVNDNTITAYRTDPYGHWEFRDFSKLPKDHKESKYTSLPEVEKAIREINNKLTIELSKKESKK